MAKIFTFLAMVLLWKSGTLIPVVSSECNAQPFTRGTFFYLLDRFVLAMNKTTAFINAAQQHMDKDAVGFLLDGNYCVGRTQVVKCLKEQAIPESFDLIGWSITDPKQEMGCGVYSLTQTIVLKAKVPTATGDIMEVEEYNQVVWNEGQSDFVLRIMIDTIIANNVTGYPLIP